MIEVQNLRKSFDNTEVLKAFLQLSKQGKLIWLLGNQALVKPFSLNHCLMFMNHQKVTFYLTEETL